MICERQILNMKCKKNKFASMIIWKGNEVEEDEWSL